MNVSWLSINTEFAEAFVSRVQTWLHRLVSIPPDDDIDNLKTSNSENPCYYAAWCHPESSRLQLLEEIRYYCA